MVGAKHISSEKAWIVTSLFSLLSRINASKLCVVEKPGFPIELTRAARMMCRKIILERTWQAIALPFLPTAR